MGSGEELKSEGNEGVIYLLPGMGASAAMYTGPWKELPNTVFLEWPEYSGETSFEAVAQRVIDENGIGAEDVVGGTSLGGMVACEVARLCGARKVVLVGSAKLADEVEPLLRHFSSLAKITPMEMVQKLVGKRDELLFEMFKQTDATFMRTMCSAIFKWKGLEKDIEIIRLHGRYDRVIPLMHDVDQVLDGGHLIVMTHAVECVNYLKPKLNYESSS